MPASRFESSVAVRGADGRYQAEIDPIWNGPVSPNGGVLAATMLRAALAELGASAPPARSITAQFLDVPAPGAVELAVDVLRRGHRVSFVAIRLTQGERLLATATVVCSAPRADPIELPIPPIVPPPRSAGGPLDPSTITGFPPVFTQLEIDPVEGAPFRRGDTARSGGWIALRDDPAPLDAARLVALCDLWWPAVFAATDRPYAVPTLSLTVDLRQTGSIDANLAYARFVTRGLREGHLDETGEVFSPAGQLLAESRQVALLIPLDNR